MRKDAFVALLGYDGSLIFELVGAFMLCMPEISKVYLIENAPCAFESTSRVVEVNYRNKEE